MLDGFRRGGNLPPVLALSKSRVLLTGSKIAPTTFDVCAALRIGACTATPVSPLKGGHSVVVVGSAGRGAYRRVRDAARYRVAMV